MSDRKDLATKRSASPPAQLHDNGLKAGSLIEQSLSRLNEEQAQNLINKAAEEGLRLEAKAREQNLDYVTGKKAMEDHVDTFNMLEKSGRTTRQNVSSDIKTGAGNMRIESKSGATCFVASVAYDDPNHSDVMYLRGFRDLVLTQSCGGRAFIAWYWRTGPKLARMVARSRVLRAASRKAIGCLIACIKAARGDR